MVKQNIKGAVSSIAVAALLAGCGGGASAPTVPHTASPTAMSFVVKVPANSSLAKAIRTRHYTSRDAQGIGLRGGNTPVAASFPNAFNTAPGGIQDYTAGSYHSFTFNLAPNASSNTPNTVMETCTSAATDGSFTCTFAIPVQAGYYDFQIALWDAAAKSVGAPSVDANNNSFPGGTPVGVETLTNKLILNNQSNSIPMALGGVVDSVQMQIDPNLFVTGGGTQSATLSAIAKDAAGDIIIGGDQYVDAGGNNLTLTAQAPTGAIASDFSFPGTTTFNTPSDTVAVNYNNGSTAGNASFSVTSSSALTGLNAPAGVSASSTGGGSIGIPGNPTVNTAGGSAPAGNEALAQDASGNVWAGVSSTTISEMLQAGRTFVGGAATTLTTGTGVQAMATAANGTICLIAQGTNEIGCFDPSTASAVGYTAALASAPNDITEGPDGDIWVAEAGGKLAHISASTSPTLSSEYDVSAAIGSPAHVTSGSDGNLWMIEQATNTVATFNPVTFSSAAVTTSGAAVSSPNLIVAGSDGNMWIAQTPSGGQTVLVKVVPGTSAATPFTIPGVQVSTMITGPDGNLWAGDSSAANQMAAISPGNGKLLKAFQLGTGVDVTAQQLLTNTHDQSVYASGFDTSGSTTNLYYFAP